MDVKSFNFVTDSMEYIEAGTKSAREYYVKGYISTEELDRANEVVSKNAMQEMLQQIKSGNVKLDVEHSTFIGENDIPVGKIIDAGIDQKGLWIKATMNKGHEKFKSIWSSIQDGFLDAFSIAYKVRDSIDEVVNGVHATILKSLELLNVAITGNPVNRGAKMTESFYKSLRHVQAGENMEQKNVELKDEGAAPATEEKPVADEAPKSEEQSEAKEEPKAEEKAEEKPEAESEAKEEPKVEEQPAESKSDVKEAVEEALKQPLDQIKSLQKDIAELKSENAKLIKKLDAPMMKGIAATDIAEVKSDDNLEGKSPLDLI